MTERDSSLVSAIITVFNGERYLAEAIESVLGQTYAPIELIVVDDGSEDGSGGVGRRFGSAIRFAVQANGGIGAARNRGVEMARGPYLAFLDADDRFVGDKIERQMGAFAADPSLEVVFGHVREFVSPELPREIAARLRPPVENAPWPTPNLMLVRREAFERVGAYSTTIKVGIGVDWCARAAEARLKALVLPVVVLERRLHSANNGLREADSRSQYARVLKAALDRRRSTAAGRAQNRS